MQSSNKSVKSRGIVAFAINTDTTDYVGIANRTLKLASKVLGLPYTIITDVPGMENNRYDIDQGKFVQWNNASRYMAYELSPYDETIVIDADYLIFDNGLNRLFKTEFDWQIMKQARGLTQTFETAMGPTSLPYVWATVFAFRKTERARTYFNLIKRIQDNYGYYKSLYNIEQRNYRNDYAFAIADIIMNGYTYNPAGIPGPMLNVDQPVTSITQKDNMFVIRDNSRAYVVPRTNLHVMSKAYLLSDQFKEFVDLESA
jgi:hypothetical protein